MIELFLSFQLLTKVCTLADPCTIYRVAECEKGSRDCFPEQRVPAIAARPDDDRGSGRLP